MKIDNQKEAFVGELSVVMKEMPVSEELQEIAADLNCLNEGLDIYIRNFR
jgi:hypothetical protein